MLRRSRREARCNKGSLAFHGMGKHEHDDRGPSPHSCRQLVRISSDAARRITATGAAAASGCVCPKADGDLRDIVRHRTRRLCQQDGSAGIRGKPDPGARRSTSSAASSPARPGAAQAAAGARLRIKGIRGQAGGFGSMGAPEARLPATMLPACGRGGAQAFAAAAGVEHLRDRAGSAFVADCPVAIRPAGHSTFRDRGRSCRPCTSSAMVSSWFVDRDVVFVPL